MKKNLSITDRIVRTILSVVLAALGVGVGLGQHSGSFLVILSLIIAISAALGACPLYNLLGIRTNKSDGKLS